MNRPFVYGYLAEKENFIDTQTIARNKKVIIAKDFVELRNGILCFVAPVFLLWFKQQYGIY